MNNSNNTRLQDFVITAAVRGQITFGDVRRLQRDCLPGGITTCGEVELLIALDRVVDRADRAWAEWLVTAIRDFAGRCAIDAAAGESHERLQALLAGPSSRAAARRIGREIISRQAERAPEPVPAVPAPQTIPFPVKREIAPLVRRDVVPVLAVPAIGLWNGMNRLKMAA